MRKFLIFLTILLSLVVCGGVIGVAYFAFQGRQPRPSAASPSENFGVTAIAAAPTLLPANTKTPSSSPTGITGKTAAPVASATPLPTGSTLDRLEAIDYPPSNVIQLKKEYDGIAPVLATPTAPNQYNIGDKETFWITRDIQTSEMSQGTATLRYKNDVVYIWVEDGERVDDAALKRSADYFAQHTYPTLHQALGTEASPGIDNDTHLHILHAHFTNEGTAGYFSVPDTLPVSVNKLSNQKEMFYINARAVPPGTDYYNQVLAHEFTHMIHNNENTRGESSWITEGFGEMGIELMGGDPGFAILYASDPDLQLDSWDVLSGAHYGQAYLFLSYQLHRFGLDYLRDIFTGDRTGIRSVQAALDKYEPGVTFDSLFADWTVATLLNDTTQDPKYHYHDQRLDLRPGFGYNRYPAQGSDTVHQYGTDYIQLSPTGRDVTLTFDGSDTVRAIPTDPHSGANLWWSGRTDLSDSTLQRELDLSAVKGATLKFWTWYDLEGDYDYAYVSASTDGGKTWKALPGKTTTNSDPNALSYGNAFTCKSGASCSDQNATSQWIQEQVDLSQYAGGKVLLRFEQVTDPVYTRPGLAIDDIEIPEIGFSDNIEGGDNGWIANGFARIDNILPQHFIVQAIEFGNSSVKIVPVALDSTNRGTYKTDGFGKDFFRVVLAVSGSTPVTWETADYTYQVQ